MRPGDHGEEISWRELDRPHRCPALAHGEDVRPITTLAADDSSAGARSVAEVRPKPAFDFGDGQAFAGGVVFHLVAGDLAEAEVT